MSSKLDGDYMFDKLKQRLSERKAFITYKLRGMDDCLCEEIDGILMPLNVTANPPSMSYIFESKKISTLVLRHSKTYRDTIEETLENQSQQTQHGLKLQPKVAEQIFDEVAAQVDRTQEIAMHVKIGGLILCEQAIEMFYVEDERMPVIFFETETEAKEYTGDAFPISITALEEFEVMNIALELISALPTDTLANIPIIERKLKKKAETILTAVNDEIVEEVMVQSSVPADKSSKIPRRLRTNS